MHHATTKVEYRAGFTQGLRWGCPKCRVIRQTAGEMSLDRFRANTVDAVWIVPGPDADLAMQALTEAEIPMVWIGGDGPPSQALIGRVHIVEVSDTVYLAMEDLIASGEGKLWQPSIESGSIRAGDINAELLSPGRQRLLEEVVEAIAAGDLDIGTGANAP